MPASLRPFLPLLHYFQHAPIEFRILVPEDVVGCFADEYYWMYGIGPKKSHPTMINTHWGGVTEDNSFDTHEFLDLCGQLEGDPYICGNVGSGTVQELSQWVEYANSDGVSLMADLRRKNGKEKAWGIKYWGIRNEN